MDYIAVVTRVNTLFSFKEWLRSSLMILAFSLTSACGDGASDSGGATTGHRGVVDNSSPDASNPTEENTHNDQANAQKPYTRNADYPTLIVYPLQFITTASGKKLGVRVTLPATAPNTPANGPFPVILTQSAYNPNLVFAFQGPQSGGTFLGLPDSFMVQRGYAHVIVDTLGTGVSEGGWEMLGEAEQAAYGDTVDWIQQQSWSNGKIGAAGVSYLGITSLFTAQRRPNDIKAVFAGVPLGDALRGTVGTGGTLNGVFMSMWMRITQILSTQNVQTALLNPQYMTQITQTSQEHVDQIDNYFLPIINDAFNGESEYTYDSDFWRVRSPLEHIDKLQAPTLFFGATDDIFQRDVPLLFEHLKKNNVDTRLIIYNATHAKVLSEGNKGNDQVAPLRNLLLQWFDKHLKGLDSGTETIPTVAQQIKNYPTESTSAKFSHNSFITTTDWPHPLATPERWYLHGDMSLTRTQPLQDEPNHSMNNPQSQDMVAGKAGAFLTWRLTLNDGTKCSPSYLQWTLGGGDLNQLGAKPPECYENNAILEQDHLNYETTDMEEDYFINGPIQADIWIDSTATEAVVSIRVDEVSQDGEQVTPITNGLLLASGRAVDVGRSRFLKGEMIQPYHYFTEEANAPLVPGEVVKLQIEIFPTNAIIRKGNKLRISISPSNQAQGMLNLPRQAMAAGGITTIHIGPQYPSSVVLPIVPTTALN